MIVQRRCVALSERQDATQHLVDVVAAEGAPAVRAREEELAVLLDLAHAEPCGLDRLLLFLELVLLLELSEPVHEENELSKGQAASAVHVRAAQQLGDGGAHLWIVGHVREYVLDEADQFPPADVTAVIAVVGLELRSKVINILLREATILTISLPLLPFEHDGNVHKTVPIQAVLLAFGIHLRCSKL